MNDTNSCACVCDPTLDHPTDECQYHREMREALTRLKEVGYQIYKAEMDNHSSECADLIENELLDAINAVPPTGLRIVGDDQLRKLLARAYTAGMMHDTIVAEAVDELMKEI